MDGLSRRRLFGSAAAAAAAAASWPTILSTRADAATPNLVPRKMPFPPNDNFGNYEPTMSADGNAIYFARFSSTGDKRVKGTTTDLFVTRRIRQNGEWPGTAGDWSPPERLPDTVNSEYVDQEPWITPDGKTLYWMTTRAGSHKVMNICFSQLQPDGQWGQAQMITEGNINSPEYHTHCFMPFDMPGQPSAMTFMSIRPRVAGEPPAGDPYTTRQVNGVWQPAHRYESRLLDSIANKCRFNVVTRDGLTLGVVTVHDFGNYHAMLFAHYDPARKEWRGPIVEAPFNDWNIDGACPTFQANGERMIWSAGYDRGPGPVSGALGDGSIYDMFWLPTSEIVAYYKARASLA